MRGKPQEQFTQDRLKSSGALDFPNQLFSYLTSPIPLKACYNYLGTAGVQIVHLQVMRKDWLANQEGPFEGMVDFIETCLTEAEPKTQGVLLYQATG